ncbi:glycoside hydrolase [Syncephalis pseudoplumigaleata]|uniref:alpha-1,2-Mannosidase n=1 Tax=Syncephalis pseudoplumigaleata TaxID=1712513 RepID=A0A4P9Z1R7_9FUNG|nr:glycoside hydrolase [Syncephalis pseudoplumigaleata]|eukprot:RKP26295.1 glycoside hydrolase [Syncephalis pseudoplumigaleata]
MHKIKSIAVSLLLCASVVAAEEASTKLNQWHTQRKAVIDAIRGCWHDYKDNALGYDEYKPISRTGRQWAASGESLGYMIIDSLDTLLLAGLDKEYEQGVPFIIIIGAIAVPYGVAVDGQRACPA